MHNAEAPSPHHDLENKCPLCKATLPDHEENCPTQTGKQVD